MGKKGNIKKEWNDAAESWVDFVRKGKDYYRDELNNPATFKLMGDVNGQIVLDLACGEGYNTRILARKGAKVTGVDLRKTDRTRKTTRSKREAWYMLPCFGRQ